MQIHPGKICTIAIHPSQNNDDAVIDNEVSVCWFELCMHVFVQKRHTPAYRIEATHRKARVRTHVGACVRVCTNVHIPPKMRLQSCTSGR